MTVGDPIAELHSTRLYIYLVSQSPEYSKRLTTFVAAIAPILATTCQYFPYYTRQDAHHGFGSQNASRKSYVSNASTYGSKHGRCRPQKIQATHQGQRQEAVQAWCSPCVRVRVKSCRWAGWCVLGEYTIARTPVSRSPAPSAGLTSTKMQRCELPVGNT